MQVWHDNTSTHCVHTHTIQTEHQDYRDRFPILHRIYDVSLSPALHLPCTYRWVVVCGWLVWCLYCMSETRNICEKFCIDRIGRSRSSLRIHVCDALRLPHNTHKMYIGMCVYAMKLIDHSPIVVRCECMPSSMTDYMQSKSQPLCIDWLAGRTMHFKQSR